MQLCTSAGLCQRLQAYNSGHAACQVYIKPSFDQTEGSGTYLEILRQLLATSISRVHGDEEAYTGIQADQATISKHKLLLALANGAQHTVYLQKHKLICTCCQ